MAVVGEAGVEGETELGCEGGCWGGGGEVCTRLHYPADLVMTAGAQEQRSSKG